MIDKFKKQLIISYKRSKISNIYKRVINKIYDDKYRIDTYYIFGKSDKRFESNYYNKELTEKLINKYLHEFNCEKSIYYK